MAMRICVASLPQVQSTRLVAGLTAPSRALCKDIDTRAGDAQQRHSTTVRKAEAVALVSVN